MRKIINLLLALVLAVICLNSPPVYASEALGVAAEALSVYGAYQSALVSILSLGNDAAAQMASRRQDLERSGRDLNPNDQALVTEIMETLIAKGDYALKANSLPFIWAVNNDTKLNAACYPTNYITVNRGLIRGLRGDRDEIAAVLAHEMTHGLEQHSAHNYAQAVAQYMAMSLINMHINSVDWYSLNRLVGYSIGTNISVPTETEADEGGFYLMAAAGFNPGGPAAAMARMSYYLRYETEDIYEFDTQEKRRSDEYSDHPETEQREKNLLSLLRAYSAAHISTQDRKNVFIDGDFFLAGEGTNESGDNRLENTYYIAGGLAKAFHDCDSLAAWNFRQDEAGEWDFLDDSPAYKVLKDFTRRKGAGGKLRDMVLLAYQKEAVSGARERLKVAERERRDRIAAQCREAQDVKGGTLKRLRLNADTYVDYGEAALSLRQIERALASTDDAKGIAECYAIRGRARALTGDFANALQDADKAISLDAGNEYNYLNLADIYHMAGELPKALDAGEKAKELAPKNPVTWYVLAGIYDDMNNKPEALTAYKNLYWLAKAAAIPHEYLKEIDPQEADRRKKQREEAEKNKNKGE